MKSAYAILGVPGNVSTEDLEKAFSKAQAHYSPARLAVDPDAIPRLMEIKDAYKLLSNPEMRAGHDRKLSAAVNSPVQRTRVVIEAMDPPWYSKPLNMLALVVVTVFAIGTYMTYSRDQVRKAELAQELAQKKLDDEATAKAEARQASLEAEQARKQSFDENRERQLRSESSVIARNAAYADVLRQAQTNRQIETDRREAQRVESQVKAEERQRANEAQRRLAADQQRIRELCYQQYRKTNC